MNLQYVFLLLSLQGHYRVTDENLLFETAQYGPYTFFRVFIALKGTYFLYFYLSSAIAQIKVSNSPVTNYTKKVPQCPTPFFNFCIT